MKIKVNQRFFIKTAILFFIISMLIAPLRSGFITIGPVTGFELSSIVGFVVIFFCTLWFLEKNRGKQSVSLILLSIFVGISVITLPIHVFNFNDTLGSLLEYLIHLLAILLAFVCYESGRYLKIAISISSLVLGLWLSVWGYNLWTNNLNFKTYTGKIEKARTNTFKFESAKGDTVSIDDFRGKVLIIDCWYTYCGYCFKAFPKVQAIYDKYKKDSSVQLIGLHSRIENDKNKPAEKPSKGQELLFENGYTFPCYSIQMGDSTLKDLGIIAYPTVLIFNKDGKLIYRGNIDNVEDVIMKERNDCT